MKQNNYINYLPFILIFIFLFLLSRWQERRNRAKAAKGNKTDEYNKLKVYSSAFAFILSGLVFQLSMLSSLPPGNEPIAAIGIIIGLAFIVFGLYKVYRYHSER